VKLFTSLTARRPCDKKIRKNIYQRI